MIVLVDSGLSNLASVDCAIQRLGITSVRTSNPETIAAAERVIFPGVGTAQAAMRHLHEKGLVDVLRHLRQPFLGICLGMQLMFSQSTESDAGIVDCLGIFDEKVDLLKTEPTQPVPHMGWNQISLRQPIHPLLDGVEEGDFVYFVHSYAAPVSDTTIAQATYGQDFTAMAAHGNFMGCQFHPEKSGAVGSRILKNFLNIKG